MQIQHNQQMSISSLLSMRSVHHQHGEEIVLSSDGGGGSLKPQLTATEFSRAALNTYKLFIVAHLLGYITVLLSIRLKHYFQRHMLAQVVHCFGILPYGFTLYYTIWLLKYNFNTIKKKQTMRPYEYWLFLEIVWHFVWLISCAFFMLIYQVFKIRPVREIWFGKEMSMIRAANDDPWNKRSTSDFLKFYKYEFFLINSQIAQIIVGFILITNKTFEGFMSIDDNGGNPRQFWRDGVLLICCMIPRIFKLLHILYLSTRGVSLDERQRTYVRISNFFVLFIMAIVVEVLLTQSYFKESNQFVRVHCFMEVGNMFAEAIAIPIMYFGVMRLRKRHEQQLKAKEDESGAEDQRNENLLNNSEKIEEGLALNKSTNSLLDSNRITQKESVQLQDKQSEDMVEFERKFCSKEKLEFKEDFNTLTMYCFLKQNEEAFFLIPQKRSSVFWSAVVVQFFVSLMLFCVTYELFLKFNTDSITDKFIVLCAKLPCMIALHLMLTPDVGYAMRIIKFAHQQSHQFVQGGAFLTFLLGLWSCLNSLHTLVLCILALGNQKSVHDSIVYFVQLKMISHFTHLYFHSLTDNKLCELIHHPPKNESRKIDFSERSCTNKCARVVYKMVRAFYVSFIYYLVPFWLFIYIWFSANDHIDEDNH